MNTLTDFTRNFERSANITELTVSAKIQNKSWSGTEDSIYISMGHEKNMQLLSDAPRVGETITVDIDIARLFGRKSIHISELNNISLYQRPVEHPIASDDWELESLNLTANGIFTNSSFRKIHKWLGNSSTHLQQVWFGLVSWNGWVNADLRPMDMNTQTYPVRWLPWIADVKSWRTYDPSKIDGVGQLVGMNDGKLIGELLKSKQTEILSANGPSDSYTWVYTPEGSIIYKRWQHRASSDYVRHSQLGSGRPVICAGEFRLNNIHDRFGIRDVIGLVNDASGHYQPDGGACLKYVEEKFRGLGINTDDTHWYWKNSIS
jgi:hypothetical protein